MSDTEVQEPMEQAEPEAVVTPRAMPVVEAVKFDKRLKLCANGAEPKRADMHTMWARDTPQRIQELKNHGFRMAKEDDIKDWSVGWLDESNVVRNGDSVLMIGPRERVENNEEQRLQELIDMNRRQTDRIEHDAGIERNEGHGSRRGGRFYSIP